MSEVFICESRNLSTIPKSRKDIIVNGVGYYLNGDEFYFAVVAEKTDVVGTIRLYALVNHYKGDADINGFDDCLNVMWFNLGHGDNEELFEDFEEIFGECASDNDRGCDIDDENCDKKVFKIDSAEDPFAFLKATLMSGSLSFPSITIPDVVIDNTDLVIEDSPEFRMVETAEELFVYKE